MSAISWRWSLTDRTLTDENGHARVVAQVRFAVTGTLDGRSESARGTALLPIPAPGGDFTPFAALTEAQVVEWIAATPAGRRQQALVESALRPAPNDDDGRWPWEQE